MVSAQAVTVIIAAAIALFVGIWVVSSVSSSVVLPSFIAANESINFIANNTYYLPVNPTVLGVTSMWNDTGHTYLYASDKYGVSSSGIRIYTNGTSEGDYNITTGTHYVTYTYQNTASNSTFGTVTGIVWNSVQLVSIGLIILAAAVLLGWLGIGRE